MTVADEQSILIVGDIFVRREQPTSVFRHVKAEFAAADFVLGNLEGACCDGGTPWQKGGINVWKADARQVEAVIDAGFHAVGVTNNHILDYGHDGLFETLGYLDKANIRYAGAGHNAAEAHAPAVLEHDGCRVAMLAYSSVFTPGWEATDERPGLAVMRAHTAFEPHPRHHETPGKDPKVRTWLYEADKAQLAADIAAARQQADIVICSFHWGVSEGHEALTDYQVELGHHAVDVGADLVFGHHPHLLQGIEAYNGKAIFYSLGNFTFARHNGSRGHELENLMARCIVSDNKIVRVEYLPVRTDEQLDPYLVNPAEAADVIALVERRSKAFGTVFYDAGDGIGITL